MNYHSMMTQYKAIDTQSKLETADKHQYIKFILEDLVKNLETLSFCIREEPKKLSIKSKCFSQILVGIMILQSSLDFENGEPIASNLFSLYDYCRKSVIKDFSTKNTKDIDQSKLVIADILDAWSKIN